LAAKYRAAAIITKATPKQLLINSMRKTSGMPYFTS
jgi:hypothetical protein